MREDGLTEPLGAARGMGLPPVAGISVRHVQFKFSSRFARFTSRHWLAMYSVVLGAWIALFALSVPVWTWRWVGVYGIEFWESLCRVDPSSAGFPLLFAMWATMSAAMMLPSFLPTLAVYEDLGAAGVGSGLGFFGLVLGYVCPWLLYSAAAAFMQIELDAWVGSGRAGWIVTAVLLGVAGLYQFAPPKKAFLAKCRSPLPFFIANWTSDGTNEFRLGVRLGFLCIGCCWLLMAMSLVAGAMNLLWMGLATVLITAEKLPQLGRYVTRPMALALIAAACWHAIANII